jgi:hypothetical protein
MGPAGINITSLGKANVGDKFMDDCSSSSSEQPLRLKSDKMNMKMMQPAELQISMQKRL